MKNLLLSVFVFVASTISAQKYELSGQIMQTSFYQGGVENPYEPIPYTKPHAKLNLIKFNEGDSIPQIVKTIYADKDGRYSVMVSSGIYGFAGFEDTLYAHQWLPQGYSHIDHMFNTSGSYWECNQLGPIEVKDKAVSEIVLTEHKSTICGMCP